MGKSGNTNNTGEFKANTVTTIDNLSMVTVGSEGNLDAFLAEIATVEELELA